MPEELVYLAALSANPSVGPRRYASIISQFKGLEGFFQLKPLEQSEFLRIRNSEGVRHFESMLQNGERIVETCRKKNIKILSLNDPEYPTRLRSIPDAPFVLYQIGKWMEDHKMVGVVGTRHATADMAAVNEYFTRELTDYNVGIVSGLAKGHDMISQAAALQNEGYTAAVLGCGIDVLYPKEAEELYQEIRLHGAVFSEYPPGTSPLPQYFPLRNRIISGLSDIVLVIQAPDKSGALITARYAEAQGRELYVVPGNPMDDKNSGTNKLIRDGARIALSPEDIVLDLYGTTPQKIQKNNIEDIAETSPEEKMILDILSAETGFDDLIDRTGWTVMELNYQLTNLEIRGLVIQYPGRYYIRNQSV